MAVGIRKAFRRSTERAGINPDQITPHTLGHTAITYLMQAGVDLPTVQHISRHKTSFVVARNAHQSGSYIEAAMNRLEMRVSIRFLSIYTAEAQRRARVRIASN